MKIDTSDLQKFFETMESKNLSLSEVIAIIDGKIKSGELPQSTTDITLTVDYTKTLEQMIADGKYDWKSSDIAAKNFPISPEMIGKKVDIAGRLFHFNHNISSEDAIKEMDNDGYRPATLMELLALGAAHPELQRQFPIAALGSVWCNSVDDRQMPYLGVSEYDRRLRLGFFDRGWAARFRFFGVRK